MSEVNVSSTAQGNSFRDSVAALLRAAHFENVVIEPRIGFKKVDIAYEENTFTQRRRIAVECKDYGRPLTKQQIVDEIWTEYRELLEARLIHQILIVGRVALNADARSFVELTQALAFKTYTELLNSVMDFGSYLQAMRAQFNEQGLNNYYVKPKLEDGTDLEGKITSWLGEPISRPIAILAGYGMGKTSFARRMASITAIEHTAASERRLPILIRLGEIANEQGLEGLLGKVFTATHSVRNYHFDLFMELNRAGRFVIILDGFDEMKHTMSWGQFKYNFQELNRLVVENSKVLLLGRPSAFLSEQEHNLVLRGIQRHGTKDIKEPGWPDYEELRLAEFTPETAYDFMAAYLRYAMRAARATGTETIDDATAEQRMAEVRGIGFEYLIGRPVQARMLADIAADITIRLREFSRFELYEIFITRLVDREQTKAARQQISVEDRRAFIRGVAWWLWQRSSSSGFHSTDLPPNHVMPFLTDSGDDLQSLKRDLLIGSMLEKKAGDTFYFAHRSFHEFLVAEYILERNWRPGEMHHVASALTPEIARFLRESGRWKEIADWSDLLSQLKGELSIMLLQLIADAMRETGEGLDDPPDPNNPLRGLLQILTRFEQAAPGREKAWDHARRLFSAATTPQTKAAATVGLIVTAEGLPDEAERIEAICALVLAQAVDEFESILGRNSNRKLVASDKVDEFARIALSCFRRSHTQNEREVVLLVDISQLYDEVERCLGAGSLAAIIIHEVGPLPVEALGRNVPLLAMTDKGSIVADFFRRYPDPSKSVIRVSTRQNPTTRGRLPSWATKPPGYQAE
jgi:hypothetical protein